jgi:hypothetical protein
MPLRSSRSKSRLRPRRRQLLTLRTPRKPHVVGCHLRFVEVWDWILAQGHRGASSDKAAPGLGAAVPTCIDQPTGSS